MYIHLHALKIIHPALDPSDPLPATLPTPRGYGWKCRRLSEASQRARGGGSMARPHAAEAWRMKTAVSQATCHHPWCDVQVRKSSTCEITSQSCKNTHKNNKHKQEYLVL
jgi:hypothetical protein